MSLDTLNNGDSGLSARTKINAAIAAVNDGAGVIRTDVLSEVSTAGRVTAASNAGLWQSIRLATFVLSPDANVEFALPVLPKDFQLKKIVLTLDWKAWPLPLPMYFDYSVQLWTYDSWSFVSSGSAVMEAGSLSNVEIDASAVLARGSSYRLLVIGDAYSTDVSITPWILGVWNGDL